MTLDTDLAPGFVMPTVTPFASAPAMATVDSVAAASFSVRTFAEVGGDFVSADEQFHFIARDGAPQN